jgi:hypothetical protein
MKPVLHTLFIPVFLFLSRVFSAEEPSPDFARSHGGARDGEVREPLVCIFSAAFAVVE